ncbi:MAG: 16S rRNA (cytosine(967)-C(5))-methyltransferase RsmB [Candidatus Latescibacteria bacterium]|jgi:16S rRNA (cytosine967-C5)-methyltransferase|nr:16S rRNA (cytosine(967)-C(5))-methyltransferase RsmB [Candidatus Latescibacterota bacterium]
MAQTPRQLALDILCRVEDGAYANHLLDAQRKKLLAKDRDLLQHLVLGTLTWLQKLDHILNVYLPKPVKKQKSALRNLLRLSVYQLHHLDRVPSYAIVNESVSIAHKTQGIHISKLVNAVLRGIAENRKPVTYPDAQKQPIEHLAITQSHPHWIIERWLDRYGFENTQKLCQINNTKPTLTIRTNTLKNTPQELQTQLAQENIHTETIDQHPQMLAVPHPSGLFQTKTFQKGLFSVQGVGAASVIDLLAPQPNETILDMCSAPGGKTTAIAEKMQNTGTITAVDLYANRLKIVRQNAKRLHITNIHTLTADANQLPTAQKFDRILLDAPCSTLGILNHHPDMRWHRYLQDIRTLAKQQQSLLTHAATHLKPNGTIVYSTCTLEPEENEHIIQTFLTNHPQFHLDPATSHLSFAQNDYLHLLPHQYTHDGTFAARLQKQS